MRALIFGLIPFCIFAAWARWHYVCQIHQHCDNTSITIEKTINERPKTLSLNDGDEPLITDHEQFGFNSKTNEPKLTEDNIKFLDKVAGYLKAKPNKSITITGNYLENEKDVKSGFYENLGQARANEIRELLLDRSIAEDRFAIDYNIIVADTLFEPVTFTLFDGEEVVASNSKNKADEEDEGFTKLKFTFTDMTYSDANFEYDSDIFTPGEGCQLYADSVKTYLTRNKDKIFTIIGHTDHVGSKTYNKDLGLRRARSAMEYFQDLGVRSEIKILSMGKTQPVASNETEAGRQKNRRVNFKIE